MTVQQRIEETLRRELHPAYLQVINESGQHNVPPGSESHFKVVVVSEAFAGQRQVKRHQTIYGLLQGELAGPVHALALHTFAPEEWAGEDQVNASPQCLGGGGGSAE